MPAFSPTEDNRLPAPPQDAQRLMAEHVRERHDLGFVLEEHVHLGGDRRLSQLLTWNPANATFICADCPGFTFQTGEITPAMVRRARLFDERLQPHLAGLYGEERDEMARYYLRGHVNRGRLRQLRNGASRRRVAARRRPVVEEGHRRLQEWMLKQRTRLPTGTAVVDAAMQLQAEDEDAWKKLAFRGYARETLRKMWGEIDQAKKDAAAEAFERRKQRRS